MTVTWTSGYSIKEALPFVEWGPKGGHQMLSPAGTLTFGRNSMCGRSVNWHLNLQMTAYMHVCILSHNYFLLQVHQHGLLGGVILVIFIQVSWRNCGLMLCMWPASTLSISIPLLVLFPYILCHKEGQSYFNSWSCCRYTYKLGHRLSDGTHIWSKSYSFRASPYPGQDSLQRVVIFRDMGKVWFFAHLGKILCGVFISVSFSI